MGFPSFVYSYGWSVALWIASYMVVPITGFAVFGKRLAQMSRRLGAITVPDLLRERFQSPLAGLTASLLILCFMTFMMVAQFKAGALIMREAWTGGGWQTAAEPDGMDRYYYVGLFLFTAIVVGYTLLGGFLAAVWTDLFQSVLMLVGILILLPLVLQQAGGLEEATRRAMARAGPGIAFLPGRDAEGRAFLPLGLAVSYFFLWVFAGLGQPATLVRVMACKSADTLRRSVYLLGLYNVFIYPPLIVICICGRALIPDLPPGQSDAIVPRLAVHVGGTLPWGGLLAGLVLTAPFGAVMSTVSSYMVVIAAGVVRDVYQRFLRPHASARELRRLSYLVMLLIGVVAVVANLQPVEYLQAIVVFSGASGAATFFMPAFMAAFWRRATAAGVVASMVAGAATVLGLYVAGWLGPDPLIGEKSRFSPYYLCQLHPVVWGLGVSVLAGLGVSMLTEPPRGRILDELF